MAREGGRSVEADQVHRDKLWSAAEGHTLTVVDEVVSDVRGLTIADLGGNTAMSIVTDVREGEFTKSPVVRLRRERLVRARVKACPAVSIKQESTSHVLIRDNVHLNRKRCRCRAVIVKVIGHPDLSVSAE